MTLTSLSFLVFALTSVLAVQLASRVPLPQVRGVVMLLANLWFVASFTSGGWSQLLPMAGFAALGLMAVRSLRRRAAAHLYALWMMLVLAVFFWLKKYSFVPEALWLASPYLMLGLSYILFRVLQLMIDTREGEITETVSVLDYLNYLLSFPTFMSGPIQRFQDWQDQHRQPAPLDWESLGEAVERMVLGVFKVVVVAPLLLGWHQGALKTLAFPDLPLTERASQGALMAGCYAVYLYYNFSGYTDIVVGVARLMGMVLPENFNRPFAAASFLDFWARWHMSLSDWLKTYVYSPVVKSLMRRYPSRTLEPYIGVVAFFVTFFLIGLWHGQTMVFALYGFLLGLGVSGNKLYQIAMIKRWGRKQYNARARTVWYQAAGRGLTFAWFAMSLVCFWAKWSQITLLAMHLGWNGVALMALLLVLTAGILFTLLDALRSRALTLQRGGAAVLHHRYLRTIGITAMAVMVAASLALTSGPAPDIVYKNF